MTREKEDELLERLSNLRREATRLIQRIVEARKIGVRDDDAINALEEISRQQAELTHPDLDKLVA